MGDRGRTARFVLRPFSFRAVGSFANAVVLLYAVSALLGAILYLYFRLDIRPELERAGHWQASASSTSRSTSLLSGWHVAAYWVCWRKPRADETTQSRIALTSILLSSSGGAFSPVTWQTTSWASVMTSSTSFHRFAFAFGTTFAVLYVIALAKDLALFTVFPSLGIVLAGTHQYTRRRRPRVGFLAPASIGTAGPPQPRLEH